MEYKVVVSSSNTQWFKLGTNQRHREDGPAIEFADGSKEWYLNGKRHREDGPAIENADGYKHWYLNGKNLTEAEFNKRMNVDTFDGKTLEIDGKSYTLTLVK